MGKRNQLTCRRHEREEDLPEERQEVEDVIAAGRHFRFAVFIFIFYSIKLNRERKTIFI
jgi:hypothetical protein